MNNNYTDNFLYGHITPLNDMLFLLPNAGAETRKTRQRFPRRPPAKG